MESLRRWWMVQGCLDYPSVDRLLLRRLNRCQFVDGHQRRFGVKRLCSLLGIARSSFYYWRRTVPARAARQLAEAELAARIRKVHHGSDGTCGAPRFTAELRDDGGLVVNHKRVARVMRTIGIFQAGTVAGLTAAAR
ncbi:IS3 family transposase [Streptomyces sp. G-G2]|uniref:IS3 family transposase n=1 Tax=Streptomyces sp. G-G2 TaxID=3046201 RepID=UPI0024B8C75E|nr:IS3 family transposase [Streptomyces sp. G-G2]MDJ0385934.1 IS3 family transposase [Streptomyces sp. G-G2]